jgi:putative protease
VDFPRETSEIGKPFPQKTKWKGHFAQVPEILAPAGGPDSFWAALNTGADAIFLGLPQFNARSRAQNFSWEEFRHCLDAAKHLGVKVCVTLNILIKESEVLEIIEVLGKLSQMEPHAVIVQDLGLVHLIRELFPSLRVHGSTQMAIHNIWGLIQASQLGIKRVVLARELTLMEIRTITNKARELGVETEVFCHGSLCYSYSGLCFFSGSQDARSGNRGECAYTCRVPYKVVSEKGEGFLFSMKDLNTEPILERLVEAGVHTLKIEGRKKDAQFVATSVLLYRNKLNQIFGRNTLPPEAQERVSRFVSDTKELGTNGISFGFQRQPTTLFMKGRYKENVIDLDNPTHKGLNIGKVDCVEENCITFVTQYPVQLHDGLRIDPAHPLYQATPQIDTLLKGTNLPELHKKYHNESIRFGVKELWVAGKRVSEAKAGDEVTIRIPSNQVPPLGGIVYKERSDALKSEVDSLLKKPNFRSYSKNISLTFSVDKSEDKNELTLKCTGTKIDHQEVLGVMTFPAQDSAQELSLQHSLQKIFDIFGEFDTKVTSLNLDGIPTFKFIPPKFLKEFKRKIASQLASFEESASRASQTNVDLWRKTTYLSNIPSKSQSMLDIGIKTDQLHLLQSLLSHPKQNPALSKVTSVVFEPKRNHLSQEQVASDGWLQTLSELTDRGIRVQLAIPTVLRAWDEPYVKSVIKAALHYQAHRTHLNWGYEMGNLGGLEFVKSIDPGWNQKFLSTDFGLYTLNSLAPRIWKEMGFKEITLHFEDGYENQNELLSRLPSELDTQIIVYKDLPLFIAESCTLTALHNGCPTNTVCGYRTLEIENPQGERFYVGHENCKSIVYAKQPYSLIGHTNKLNSSRINRMRVDFVTRPYDWDQCLDVLNSLMNHQIMEISHFGNFERGLL